MRHSRSMGNLQMLPEEEKQAASLLRLTLSDKQEPSEFQSYITTHSQFPYHKAVCCQNVKVANHTNTTNQSPYCIIMPTSAEQKKYRLTRKGSNKGENVIYNTSDDNNNSTSTGGDDLACSRLSQDSPNESQGFFQRLVASFRRRSQSRAQSDDSCTNDNSTSFKKETVVLPQSPHRGHVVGRFSPISSQMDSLIFMSLR